MNGIPGTSLRGWRSFFPKANFMVQILIKSVYLRKIELRQVFVTNKMKKHSKSCLIKILRKLSSHLIIDDGLHATKENINTLTWSFSHLKKGGIM